MIFDSTKKVFVAEAACHRWSLRKTTKMVRFQLCYGSTSIKKQSEGKQNALTWAIYPCQTTSKIQLGTNSQGNFNACWLNTGTDKQDQGNEWPERSRSQEQQNKKRNKWHPDAAWSKPMTHLSKSRLMRNLFSVPSQFHFICLASPWKTCDILDLKEHKCANKFLLRHSPLCGKCQTVKVKG